MATSKNDLFAMAPREATDEEVCLRCGKLFIVSGGYTPHYNTFLSWDDYEDNN